MSKEIFVFGSNLLGIHGAGAAKTAKLKYGAKSGYYVGRTGDAYAIPTKSKPTPGTTDTLPIDVIKIHVDTFIKYANENPDLTFLLTKIGCGLAGYSEDEIKPLFQNCPPNVKKPENW